ncbi:MAG TPA: PxKF domain-containing protein [Pyrinomonadaceae bacterium]|nr:PxKF domain-containing protein [Pyrinomonadaceae bacterium]
MKTTSGPASSLRRKTSLVIITLFILVAAALAVPFYSVKSNSVKSLPEQKSASRTAIQANNSKPVRFAALTAPFAPQAAGPEGIAVYDSDCTTPKTSFVLGETVCAGATNAPTAAIVLRRFSWAVRAYASVQSTNITTTSQNDSFTLPATAFSVVNGETIDNRAVWRVCTTDTSDSSLRTCAYFSVSDPATPAADIGVNQGSAQTSGGVAADTDVVFNAIITNDGPDSAQGVALSNSTPANTTFVSAAQTAGSPSFSCTTESGTTNCVTTDPFLPGGTATFTFTYHVNAGTATGTQITNQVSVAGTTTELDANNNSSTFSLTVTAQGTPPSDNCAVACPDDIETPANTTDGGGNPGAIVHFSPPSGNEECGDITVDHCNDCFFPEGATVVTATSETGDTCSFTVTVTPAGSAPTISCPGNKTADADASVCSTNVNVGTATATGQNVTVIGYRSDGAPMYTCDAFGNCTRNSSDAPFSAGTTTITWYAYSHDAPGPYTGPVDGNGDPVNPADTEEGHRNGSATCTQTVMVNDVTPPNIAATDSTVSADANCQAVIPDYSSTVTDNCACGSADDSEACEGHPHITYTQTPAAGTVVGTGAHNVHIEATDGSSNNNGATKDVTFTVNDTTAPEINCPANITANTDPGTCSATVDPGTATAPDNCDTTPTIVGTRSDNQALNAPYPKGTTTIHWTATDDAGNTSSCDQTITVEDHEPPTISCPANITVYLPANTSDNSMVVNYTAPVGQDNCAGATTTQTAGLASGASFPVGTTTNTFRVTDGAGNYTECSFTVTVLYNFTGFFSPVNNPPVFNNVNAGKTIPVKFSLSGNKGLGIFAPGYPVSQQIACNTSAPLSDLEGTETTGGSTLTYSPDTYHYGWKTESGWAGTCRMLIVKLKDGTEHTALFKFK